MKKDSKMVGVSKLDIPVQKKDNGVISFEIPLIECLCARRLLSSLDGKVKIGNAVKEIICSDRFVFPQDVVFDVSILPGTMFSDENRNIATAEKLGQDMGIKNESCYQTAVVACLMHVHAVSLQEHGINFWSVLSRPFTDHTTVSRIFGTVRSGWLDAVSANPRSVISRQDHGFALVSIRA